MRRSVALRGPVLVTACLTMIVGAAGLGYAQTGGGDQQQQLQSQVAQLDQAGAAALTSLQGVQQRQAALDSQVADLTNQLNVAQTKLTPLADQAARLDASVAALQSTMATTQSRLDDAQHSFDASAAGLYRSARAGAQYETVLASQPADLLAQSKYLGLVSQQRRALVDEVTSLRD